MLVFTRDTVVYNTIYAYFISKIKYMKIWWDKGDTFTERH
jgi:hypothetical protein